MFNNFIIIVWWTHIAIKNLKIFLRNHMNPDMFPIAMFGLKNIGKESKYQGFLKATRW